MQRTPFTAITSTGVITGWVAGQGPKVLALHGGPALSYSYLDELVAEVAGHYSVATYQQRGLEPSTTQGAFTVAEAVGDVAAVLDELGWEAACLLGHSWGGHLALHVAVAIPNRVVGVLAIDPLGLVGDGGAAAFQTELVVRMPDVNRPRFAALEAKELSEGLTAGEDVEQLGLLWPSYFADPSTAPVMPPVAVSQPASAGLAADRRARLPALQEALPSLDVPVGVLVGERSPIPTSGGRDIADRIPGGWWHVVAGAGHFVWLEVPGAVLMAMDRLTQPLAARHS